MHGDSDMMHRDSDMMHRDSDMMHRDSDMMHRDSDMQHCNLMRHDAISFGHWYHFCYKVMFYNHRKPPKKII